MKIFPPDEFDVKDIIIEYARLNKCSLEYSKNRMDSFCRYNIFNEAFYFMDFKYKYPKRKLLIEKQLYK